MQTVPNVRGSVLIVDDELGPRESIRAVLEHRFQVTTAESGEQALDFLRRQRIDVVTLDLNMPGLGGIETFKQIRELDPYVEVVVISAAASSFERIAAALPHRASAWVAKPFDAAQLVHAVERAAERSRGRERTEQSRVPPVPRRRERALEVTMNFLHAEESDGGLLQLHKTSGSLNEIVAQVMEEGIPGARLKRIELQADLDSSLPFASLDVAMIARALTNLLDNAVHHSPDWEVVHIETRSVDGRMILRVRDYGPGIPAEEISQLFQRYGRGVNASRSSAGLGLYLVRTIAEAHGGSVSVAFPPGGGSSFTIILPCP